MPDSNFADLTQMREFGDVDRTRQNIYDQVLQAAKGIPSVSNKFYSLSIVDPHYEGKDVYSLADQKKATLEGTSLTRKLRGTYVLKDPEGQEVSRKVATLAQIPHMTHRGTFILNGSSYSLSHQMRLRPGIYHRLKENGETEAHVNIMPGKGLAHRYSLDPETGIFKMQVRQSAMPLLPVLRSLGATDQELRDVWGKDLHAANSLKDDPKVIDKLYERLLGKKGQENATQNEKSQAVANAISMMELDPEVTSRTLGKPYAKLSKEAILASTKKLLDISRGQADVDDRDHLAFQHFLGPEELIAERMGKDKSVLHKLLWRSTNRQSVENIAPNVFTPHVHAAIMDSGLGNVNEEVNPSELLDQQTRVSRLGTGGITSIDSIPDEARSVQPSHLGYIDLLRSPESFKAGVDSRMSYTARKGNDRRVYTPFRDPRTNQLVWKSPQDIADLTIGFPGSFRPGELVPALIKGKTTMVPMEQVDLFLPHMEQAFSPINNLVPLKSALKGQRAAMASRFITQALPLKYAEAPLVRGQVPGQPGRSFEEHYGRFMGAVLAKNQPGRVQSVDASGVTVKYADGTTETHELYNNYPYNRKTAKHNTPVVRSGDAIQPGQLLARSNYTDEKGHTALGKNLRGAYIPLRGLNHEDAYVVSESAAKKLTSEHLYQHPLEWEG